MNKKWKEKLEQALRNRKRAKNASNSFKERIISEMTVKIGSNMANIKVIKNAENPEPTPVLAEAIIRISDAITELNKSDLNERAIITLIVDGSSKYKTHRISKETVHLVLDTIRELRGRYCRTQPTG